MRESQIGRRREAAIVRSSVEDVPTWLSECFTFRYITEAILVLLNLVLLVSSLLESLIYVPNWIAQQCSAKSFKLSLSRILFLSLSFSFSQEPLKGRVERELYFDTLLFEAE